MRFFELSEHLLHVGISRRVFVPLVDTFQNLQLGHIFVDLEHYTLAPAQLVKLTVDPESQLLALAFQIFHNVHLERTPALAISSEFKIDVVCDALVAHELHFVVIVHLLQAGVTLVAGGLHHAQALIAQGFARVHRLFLGLLPGFLR